MINACVSHELRNPLNSIISRNIEKLQLYRMLQQQLDKDSINREQCVEIVDKLLTGIKTQENSTIIMKFMVQDLLDWAQIRSNKFRKNIKSFNIMKSVEAIMDV